jgi:hypothetical protein
MNTNAQVEGTIRRSASSSTNLSLTTTPTTNEIAASQNGNTRFTPLDTPPIYNILDQTPVPVNNAYQRLQRRHFQQYITIILIIPVITFLSAFISISAVGGGVSYSSFLTLIIASMIIMIMETFKIIIVVAMLVALIVLCFLVTVQMNLKSNRTLSPSSPSDEETGRPVLSSRSARALLSRIVSNLTCESLFIGPIMSRFEYYLKRNLFCTVAMVLAVFIFVFIFTYLLLSTMILLFTSWLVSDFKIEGFGDRIKISFIMFLVNLSVLLWGGCMRVFFWKPNSNVPVDPSDSYASDMIQQLRQQFTPLVMSPDSEEEYMSEDMDNVMEIYS